MAQVPVSSVAPGDDALVAEIRRLAGERKRIVFVSGNFNIVHPGHLRLLKFAAECGDFLVVGVNRHAPPGVTIRADIRLEGVRAIGIVGYAFLLDEGPEALIARLRPAVVVKGKEHEHGDNPEREVVASYGGKLLFGSGEVAFSSLDLLQREFVDTNFSVIRKPTEFLQRHDFDCRTLEQHVRQFARLRVTVIGDLIVDEYINCDAIGMSQEDPTVVVTPIRSDSFVGGAGIVAAHASGLGARVRYVGVAGRDSTADFARQALGKYGVEADLVVDQSRPTTLKQRYRANGKTLLRVSHLKKHDISMELGEQIYRCIADALHNSDLVFFSDFNYGCLPQHLVERIQGACRARGVMTVADSQASSQIGDVSRFRGMQLLTPTEHEARIAMRDYNSGLVALADDLRRRAEARHLFITLGAEGLLIHAGGDTAGTFQTDQLPAFNTVPKDVSGAGDSLFACASMALALSGNIWQSAYLGSVAAACQVSRVGNLPLSADELLQELRI